MYVYMYVHASMRRISLFRGKCVVVVLVVVCFFSVVETSRKGTESKVQICPTFHLSNGLNQFPGMASQEVGLLLDECLTALETCQQPTLPSAEDKQHCCKCRGWSLDGAVRRILVLPPWGIRKESSGCNLSVCNMEDIIFKHYIDISWVN